MKAHEFCYWLQGHFELVKAADLPLGLGSKQVECIQRHLAMVFKHEIDPKYSNDPEVQEELSQFHNGPSGGGITYRC